MLRISDFGTSQSIGRDNCAIVGALKLCIRSERQNISDIISMFPIF